MQAGLLNPHVAPVADHVRHDIGGGVPDFVGHLLANGRNRHETARFCRLGQFQNDPSARHSAIGKPIRSQPSTARQSVRMPPVTRCAAFDEMSDQRAG